MQEYIYRMTPAQLIETIVAKHGLTRHAISKRTGISYPTILHIYDGRTKTPGARTVDALRNLLADLDGV